MLNEAIIVLLLYLFGLCIYKEREMMGCDVSSLSGYFFGTPSCDNTKNHISKLVPESENPFDPFHRVVLWRRCFVLSLLTVFIYHILMGVEFNGPKFLAAVVCGTFFIYFSFAFYHFHLDSYVEKDISKFYTITKNPKG